MNVETTPSRLMPWIAPCVLILAWEILARAGTIPRELLPAPFDVVRAGARAIVHGALLEHRGVSALRAFGGLLIGGTLGVTLGLLTGLSRPLQLAFDGPVQCMAGTRATQSTTKPACAPTTPSGHAAWAGTRRLRSAPPSAASRPQEVPRAAPTRQPGRGVNAMTDQLSDPSLRVDVEQLVYAGCLLLDESRDDRL